MERAHPGKGIARNAGEEQVSHLRMDKPVQELPPHHHPPADARADREIDEIVQTGGVAPVKFAEGGGVGQVGSAGS